MGSKDEVMDHVLIREYSCYLLYTHARNGRNSVPKKIQPIRSDINSLKPSGNYMHHLL
jgi:hypothetical protein